MLVLAPVKVNNSRRQQQCHVAIHNFYLRTTLQCTATERSMRVYVYLDKQTAVALLLRPSIFIFLTNGPLQAVLREETRIVLFLFLWEMGLLGSQASSKNNILLLKAIFSNFRVCTRKCKRKTFRKVYVF